MDKVTSEQEDRPHTRTQRALLPALVETWWKLSKFNTRLLSNVAQVLDICLLCAFWARGNYYFACTQFVRTLRTLKGTLKFQSATLESKSDTLMFSSALW